MVGGRTVEVNLALSQDDARNLASGGRAASGLGKDNRNLYLVPAHLHQSLPLFSLVLPNVGAYRMLYLDVLQAVLPIPFQHSAHSMPQSRLYLCSHVHYVKRWPDSFACCNEQLSKGCHAYTKKEHVYDTGKGGNNRGGLSSLGEHERHRQRQAQASSRGEEH